MWSSNFFYKSVLLSLFVSPFSLLFVYVLYIWFTTILRPLLNSITANALLYVCNLRCFEAFPAFMISSVDCLHDIFGTTLFTAEKSSHTRGTFTLLSYQSVGSIKDIHSDEELTIAPLIAIYFNLKPQSCHKLYILTMHPNLTKWSFYD